MSDEKISLKKEKEIKQKSSRQGSGSNKNDKDWEKKLLYRIKAMRFLGRVLDSHEK